MVRKDAWLGSLVYIFQSIISLSVILIGKKLVRNFKWDSTHVW